jgi:hypothetical protein
MKKGSRIGDTYMLETASELTHFILNKAFVESPAKKPHMNLGVCHNNQGHADSGARYPAHLQCICGLWVPHAATQTGRSTTMEPLSFNLVVDSDNVLLT